MPKPGALPQHVLYQLERLQEATRQMPGLESQIDFLEQRLENGDMSAAHVGIRTSAEALLRHAARVEELPRVSGPLTLSKLAEVLRPKLRDRVDEAFWAHLGPIQDFGNQNAHYQMDDVYLAAGLRRANPWSEVELCLGHLVSMVVEFTHHWPPRPAFTIAVDAEGPAIVPEPALQASGRRPSPAASGELGERTARHAREDDATRRALEAATGMTRTGISRRLNAAHGRTKLRNVFPEHLGGSAPVALEQTASEEDAALDYEAIGNLTISEARELEVAAAIARLTSSAEATVKRKLAELHGRGVVRRQFSWYDAGTIAELTARTALDYRMVWLLARGLHRGAPAVDAALRNVPGQTKLRNVFPDLER